MPPRHGTPPRHRPVAAPARAAVAPLRGRVRAVTFADQLMRSSSTGTPTVHNSRCGLLRPVPPLPLEPVGGKIDGEFFRFGSRHELPAKTTELHAECARGNVQAVSELLGDQTPEAAKAMLQAQDKELGWTALHLAAAHGQPAVVEALLKAGASADVEDDYGMTPLHLAAEDGCSESAELLVTKVRERRGSIEYLAERTGHHDLGERLAAYWEIVAEIESQQRDEKDASADGVPSPSPSSPPTSPTLGAFDREDESAALDESEGALDISLGAIRTVSASELPPPPPPPRAVAPWQSQQHYTHDRTWTPSRTQLSPQTEPEPEPQVDRPQHQGASWQHHSHQSAPAMQTAWVKQPQQHNHPLRPPMPPQQQQQPYPSVFSYGVHQPPAAISQHGGAQQLYVPPRPGAVSQHLVAQPALHQQQYSYGHGLVSSLPHRPQPYAQAYDYVGPVSGGGGAMPYGYYGGPTEMHAATLRPAVPTPVPYTNSRVVHKYEI